MRRNSSLWQRELEGFRVQPAADAAGRGEGYAEKESGNLPTLVGGRAFAQSAVVNNGSDAAARLNMRGQPSKDADSLGQFYTGTPVNIVSDAGNGWSQVTIGSGNNSLSGYMMTAYLSADASSVTDATLYMEVTSPYGTQSIIVRSEPSNSYDAVAALVVGDSVRVIGTAGSYYYVLLSDQSVGCLSTSEVK